MEVDLTRLLLVFAIACSGNRTTPPSNVGSGSGSGSSSGSGDVAPTTPVVVTDSAGVVAAIGKTAEVHGTAKNAKLAAAVIVDGLVVYCLGVDSWPTKLANGQVVARGKLEHTDEFAADGTSGGTTGKVYVLRACAYESAPVQ